MKTTTPLLPVLALAAALAGCGDKAPPAPEAQAQSPIVQGQQIRYTAGHPQLALLTTVAAAPGKSVRVELPARLVWNEERTQRIYPAFAGRVASIKADIGTAVKPGTLLAQLASPDFGIAQADTAKAQADSALTRKNVQRQRELFEAGIIARKDLEQAEAEAARAGAEVARAQARTAMYGGSGSGIDQRFGIVSGINGVVVERNLNPGQELRTDQSGPGTPALFVISDPSALWVQIDARESEVGTLRPGAVFKLIVPTLPGEQFEGEVLAAADFIDPASRTIKVRGKVDNTDRRLKAEMLATARFERTLGSGVVVPASAVMLRGAQHLVFVQPQENVFEPREVTIRYEGPREIVIAGGLEVGEMVVRDNALLLLNTLANAQDEARAAPGAAAAGTNAPAASGAAGRKP